MTGQDHLNPDTDLPVTLTRRAGHPGWVVSSPVCDATPAYVADTTTLAQALARLWRDRDPNRYPHPPTTDVAPRPPGRVSNTSWNVDLWKPLPGGYWLSPTGKVYQPGGQTVQRVIAKRAGMGLSTEYDEPAKQEPEEGWVQEWMTL